MSLNKTREQLIKLLGESENNVIALSGEWGTGKTHLWNEVKKSSDVEKIKNSLYVSLFGLSSIDQLKRKLLESAIPVAGSHGKTFEVLKNLFRTGVTAASQHYKALAAINDLNLLLLTPVVLRDKVIVIDDIERKHERLGIEEVLGFIDEYSKQFTARFVLLLNDDRLSSTGDQVQLWATLREKVIDQEIKLTTSADEAFTISIGLVPSKYADSLKQASITCRLTNIRTVVKMIRIANQILGGRDLGAAVQARVVPSIVLFSAIHYRGLTDGPDFQFALNVGNPDWLGYAKVPNKDPTQDEKQQEGWRMLMRELGINGCGEFEMRLVEFLESGLFEAASIEAIIDRYVTENAAMEAREGANVFLKRVLWDHRVDEAQLVAEAADFPARAGLLDPFIATELASSIKNMPGGAEIGEAIVDGWIDAFRNTHPKSVNDENPFNNPLHPKIQAEFDEVKAAVYAKKTLVDACMTIMTKSGWGTLEEVAMRRATAGDFESAIRTMEDLVQLRRFMRGMIDMRLHQQTYDPHFGTATQRFVDACRNIANDAASPRLAGLIKHLFQGTTLAPELTHPADAVGQQE